MHWLQGSRRKKNRAGVCSPPKPLLFPPNCWYGNFFENMEFFGNMSILSKYFPKFSSPKAFDPLWLIFMVIYGYQVFPHGLELCLKWVISKVKNLIWKLEFDTWNPTAKKKISWKTISDHLILAICESKFFH